MSNAILLGSESFGDDAEFTIPPGDYYVGDPCYVLGDDLYDELNDLIFPTVDSEKTIHVACEGAHIVNMRTHSGDGQYRVEIFRSDVGKPSRGILVDSGGVAVIDKRLCVNEKYNEDQIRTFSAHLTLKKPAVVSIHQHNLTVLGHLEVVTNEINDCDDE